MSALADILDRGPALAGYGHKNSEVTSQSPIFNYFKNLIKIYLRRLLRSFHSLVMTAGYIDYNAILPTPVIASMSALADILDR
ncbi:MAG: hypothetical protein J5836_03465, partial [Clostridia bacterium]|nr:hypothetical protein [Clostridia bacterium]